MNRSGRGRATRRDDRAPINNRESIVQFDAKRSLPVPRDSLSKPATISLPPMIGSAKRSQRERAQPKRVGSRPIDRASGGGPEGASSGRPRKGAIEMKRFALIAATATLTLQPMASLPVPARNAEVGRAAGVSGSSPPATQTAERRRRGAPSGPRAILSIGRRADANVFSRRPGQVHDRCVPSRESIRISTPAKAGRALDNPLRTPTFLPK